MTNMLQFLKRKIKPFKKCTGNPSYSFEINTSPNEQQIIRNEQTTNLDLNDCEFTGYSQNLSSKLGKMSKKRFYLKFKRSKKGLTSSTDLNNNSLNNREKTHSFSKNSETIDSNKDQNLTSIENEPAFDTPASSISSNYNNSSCHNLNYYSNGEIEWGSESDSQSYTNERCINELIENTNYTQDCLGISLNNNSMVTYNTKYANNSNVMDDVALSMKPIGINKHVQQSTPFDEISSPVTQRKIKRRSKVISENGEMGLYRRSKTFQSQKQLIQDEIEESSSPIFRKMDVKHSRKCRRSNTTFTMAGVKKNKIIDYFNNLEMTKPIKKNQKLYSSNREICSTFQVKTIKEDEEKRMGMNNSKASENLEVSKASDQSKNEIEKIHDLFFYDESLLSNRDRNETDNMTGEKHILSTFLDSPISVATDKSAEITPVYRKNESKLIKMNEITSTNSSIEKFRRSSSMPGLNEPNLSIQANNSKINALKSFEEELNMNITPKKALLFDQNDNASNSIENLSTPEGHFISSFEVSDDEPKPFVRGQSRNLSKNIKQMFKNIVKLQMDALNNLEKFYEAQLLKVEADRKQNLELNPMNKVQINEFFDRQLELLEERVQINLENISKDKNRRMNSNTSLRYIDNMDDDSDDSIQKVSKSIQKQIISKKLAQIISSNQTCNNGRRTQSKNLLELKNNLINQKNLLPSKIQANQSSDESPSMFKRNLSLPFKQCKQNYFRVRNESAHETVHLSNKLISSSKSLGKSLMNFDISYNMSQTQYQKNSNRQNDSNDDIKKAKERRLSNNMAKIVKLSKKDENRSFEISANSAFKPIKKDHPVQDLLRKRNNVEAYEEIKNESILMNQNHIFKPISLDVRRNSSIFFNEENSETEQRRHMPVPRLSDSHLLFKIKQERRMNESKKITSTYQKQYQSKIQQTISRLLSRTNFHIETEV